MKKIKTTCTHEEYKFCVIPCIHPMQLNINTGFFSLFRNVVGTIYLLHSHVSALLKVDVNYK